MNEEAIEYFKFHRKIFCDDHLKICPKDSIAYQATLKEKEFYDLAIKALEQEPCDAISRQAVIRWVKTECNPYGKPTLDFESGKKVIEHLKQMAPVTPQPKTGQENINAVLEDIVEWATHNDYGFISVDCSIRHGVYLDELIEYIKSIYVDEVEE